MTTITNEIPTSITVTAHFADGYEETMKLNTAIGVRAGTMLLGHSNNSVVKVEISDAEDPA